MPIIQNGTVIGFFGKERCDRCSPIEAALGRSLTVDHEGLKQAMLEVQQKMSEAGTCGAYCVPLIKILSVEEKNAPIVIAP